MKLSDLEPRAGEILQLYEEPRAAMLPLLWLVQENQPCGVGSQGGLGVTSPPKAARLAPSRGSDQGGDSARRSGQAATVGASRARVGGTVVRRYDPAAMAPAARIAELAGILAAGYRRLRLNRLNPQNGLAESAEPEAPCDPAVNGDGAESAQEMQ